METAGEGRSAEAGPQQAAAQEAVRAEFEHATALAGWCVCVCVRGVTSCHTAGSSAAVRHICRRAQGPCLRAGGSEGTTSPAEHSDHISNSVNKLAAVTVTLTTLALYLRNSAAQRPPTDSHLNQLHI